MLPPSEAQTERIAERVTVAQRAAYDDRGGKTWLVRLLNRQPRKPAR